MKKILGAFLGIIIGYCAWLVIKWAILLSGAFLLGPIGISGPRVAANLEAGAEILGFIVFLVILSKIYRAIVGKNKKPKSIESISKEVKKL